MTIFSRVTLFFVPLIYLLAAASLSALLAYPLHFLMEGLFPYTKIVSRGALLLLILGIYPIARWIRLTRCDFGFCGANKAFFYRCVVGLGFGALILGFVAVLLVVLEVRVVDWEELASLSTVASSLSKALTVAIIVALLEEPLFRGLLLGGLLTRSSQAFAILTSACYYALLHFLHSELTFADSELTWVSGYMVVLDAFSHLLDIRIIDSFLALFLAGIFLALVRLHLKCGLGYCIGLHAGWVFVIKTSKALTDRNPNSPWAILVSDYDGIIGYLSAGWLVLMITGLLILLRSNRLGKNKITAIT